MAGNHGGAASIRDPDVEIKRKEEKMNLFQPTLLGLC
jgi:hypothetical protein